MQRRLRVIASPIIILSVVSFAVFSYSRASSQVADQSPYVNQLSSPVRGLSAQEVDNLLNGRGAGYARMAELNSYPGPAHILEIKKQLNLSAKQTQKIEAAFQTMNAKAKRIGQNIVEGEQELSASFASGKITPAELQTQTELLAALYGELRATHLEAHLEVTPLLSPKQIITYNTLRGYTSSESPNVHHKN
jgi:Spy/CpxP family protein refolding chaperone